MLNGPQALSLDIPGLPPLPELHTVRCWQWGNPDAKEAVICVHGLTRNGRDFDYLAGALCDQYQVLCPDMPGRGQSAPLPDPAGYNTVTYIADIAYMLDQLHIEKLHWVGTSMGGIIGMAFNQAHPGRIESLILNDVGALIPAAGLKRILSYAGAKMDFPARADAEATLRRIAAPFGITDEAQWQHLFRYSVREKTNGKFELAFDPSLTSSFSKSDDVQDVNLWPLWNALDKVPVLVIRGKESDILPAAIAHEMAVGRAGVTVHEVEGAGHAPALMDDKETAFIRNWLNAVKSHPKS